MCTSTRCPELVWAKSTASYASSAPVCTGARRVRVTLSRSQGEPSRNATDTVADLGQVLGLGA